MAQRARRPKGTGTIRPRDGRWQGIVRYVDPRTGERRQTAQTFDSQNEAQAWITATVAEIDRNGPTVRDVDTVADFLALWLQSRDVTDLSPKTQSWYRGCVTDHVVPALGHMKLDRLTPAQLDAFLASKRTSGRKDGRPGGLGQASIHRIHVTLSKSLRWGHRMRLIGRNPMDDVDRPEQPRTDPTEKVWTMQQIDHFLSTTESDRLYALWWLAAWTGMRRGEILGLRWSDLDLESGVLSIRRALILVDGKPMISTPKTNRGRRLVELDDRTVAVLRKHRTTQVADRLAAGSAWQDTDHVFCWEDGRPLNPDWTSHRFLELGKLAGLPRIPLHGLRHSHATALLRSGAHPKVVQERLGHASASFTMDRYSAVLPAMQRDAVDRLCRAIGDA